MGRKLFSSYIILSFLYFVIFSVFVYFFSSQVVKERASLQMISVRSLASKKLLHYFEKIKWMALHTDVETSINDIPASLLLSTDVIMTLKGDSKKILYHHQNHQWFDLPVLKDLTMTEIKQNHLALQVPVGDQKIIWVFNYQGMRKEFFEPDGLGKTGEIYLVNKDLKITTNSRFLSEVAEIVVDNESTRKALENKSGVHLTKDYRGIKVISSYGRFKFDDLDFIILSEIDWSEVIKSLDDLFKKIALMGLFLSLLSIAAAFYSSQSVLMMIEKMYQDVANLNVRALTTQEKERNRISINLHDGVGQILTALKWKVQALQKKVRDENIKKEMNDLSMLCEESIQEIRNVSDDIKPLNLELIGCFRAINENLLKICKVVGININYIFQKELEEYKFRDGLDINLYRLIQELIQNTIKHASASEVVLNIHKHKQHLVIEYEDNGLGMKEQNKIPDNINYRVELMNGIVKIKENRSGKLNFLINVEMTNVFNEKV